MKKHLSLLLAVLLVLGLFTGCQKDGTPTQPEVSEIRNIVLIIGDGMGPAQMEAGELSMGEKLAFRDWQNVKVNTDSVNAVGQPVLTDSAAAATALATGTLTINSYVGIDPGTNELRTILDYAGEYGKATGIVTTDDMDGATPAGFSGHARDRDNQDAILSSQLTSGVKLLCANYTPEAKQAVSAAKDSGYTWCDDYSKIKDTMQAEKAYWLFETASSKPFVALQSVTKDALEYLARDEDGFVLMIEQAYVDKYCHSNQILGTVDCVESLNETVKTVVDWAQDRDDTAILVTADHETGGLKVSKDASYPESCTSRHGNTFYYQYTTTSHTQTPVYLYYYGFAPDLTGYYLECDGAVIKNKSIFNIMLELLKNPKK